MTAALPPVLYLCMGSACHQSGVYHVLPVLQRLLTEHQLDHQIELKGAFCLGVCLDAVAVQYRDRIFLNISLQNIEQRFKDEILPALQT